jgi:hypothetical protein
MSPFSEEQELTPMLRRIPIEIPNNAPERSVPQVGEIATGILLLTAFLYVVGALVVTLDLDRYGVSNFDLTQARYLVVGAWWFSSIILWTPVTAFLVLVLSRTLKIISEAFSRDWPRHERDLPRRLLAVFRFCLPGVSPDRVLFGFFELTGRGILVYKVFPLIAPTYLKPPATLPRLLIHNFSPLSIASVSGGLFLLLLLSDLNRLHWEAERAVNLGVSILIAFDMYLFVMVIAFYAHFVYPTFGQEIGGGKKPLVVLQLTENSNIDWHSADIRASTDGKTVGPVELLFDTPTTVTIASPEAVPSTRSPFVIPVGPKPIELDRRIINAVKYIPGSGLAIPAASVGKGQPSK